MPPASEGRYEVLVGSSVEDIRARGEVVLLSSSPRRVEVGGMGVDQCPASTPGTPSLTDAQLALLGLTVTPAEAACP